jgi:hypothetical protein
MSAMHQPGWEQALAAALRARAGQPPRFQAALHSARMQPARSPALRQALLAGCVLAMAGSLAASWRGVSADALLASDMALARSLSPERQWRTPSDALLDARGFHTPVIVELPGIHNPFKESLL